MGLFEDLLGVFIPGYAFAKNVAEQEVPGKTLSVENILITGDPTQLIRDKEEKAPPFALDFLANLFETLEKDPKSLALILRPLIVTLTGIASAISFIPTTNNLGGPLAARLIGDMISPFLSTVYDSQVRDQLDNLFPTREAPARLLVSGIEAGAIDDSVLIEELVDAGLKDRSIQAVRRFAAVKRFEAATREDMATLRQYQQALTTFTIGTLQDELRATLTDLRSRRSELARELRGVRASV